MLVELLLQVLKCLKTFEIKLVSEEVDEKLKGIMLAIHASCVKYGKDSSGYVDYVKGALLDLLK
jgi:glutamate dehydrogenase/leucine dehydrogenase